MYILTHTHIWEAEVVVLKRRTCNTYVCVILYLLCSFVLFVNIILREWMLPLSAVVGSCQVLNQWITLNVKIYSVSELWMDISILCRNILLLVMRDQKRRKLNMWMWSLLLSAVIVGTRIGTVYPWMSWGVLGSL